MNNRTGARTCPAADDGAPCSSHQSASDELGGALPACRVCLANVALADIALLEELPKASRGSTLDWMCEGADLVRHPRFPVSDPEADYGKPGFGGRIARGVFDVAAVGDRTKLVAGLTATVTPSPSAARIQHPHAGQ